MRYQRYFLVFLAFQLIGSYVYPIDVGLECNKLTKIIARGSEINSPGTPEENRKLIAHANDAARGVDGYLGSAIYFGDIVHFVRPGTNESALIKKMLAVDSTLVPRGGLGGSITCIHVVSDKPDQLRGEFRRAVSTNRGYGGFDFSPESGFKLYWDNTFQYGNRPENFGPYPVTFVPVTPEEAEKNRNTRLGEQ